MRKMLRCLVMVLTLSLIVMSVASAEVEVVNLSPELVQDVQLLGNRNDDNNVVIAYGADVLAFRLLRNANVKITAEPCFINGAGGPWCSAELTADGLAAGEQSIAWEDISYINLDADDGVIRIWSQRGSTSVLFGTVSISAEATGNDSEPEEPAEEEPTEEVCTWYSHNTLGLVGLPLRDLYPDLTDRWYNVVPVDLTVQGRQTYPLVASNLFYMGTACVDILGDSVTVTYQTPGNRWTAYLAVEDEALVWFTSVSDITSAFLENPVGEVAFGQPVSISEQLNGQDVALLFICNHVTYRQPCIGETGYLTRYWPNLPEWKAYRESLLPLLDRLPE